jgi:DNA-binding PadR family transcriptional regulator
LLSEKPSTGYDIRKTIKNELSHFWNESYGQIYPILNGLADERLATRRRSKQKGKPDRQVYSITARGKQVLQEWLSDEPAMQTERNETLLKLLFAGNLDVADRLTLIEWYREKQRELLARLDDIELTLESDSESDSARRYGRLTISHGRAEARARMRWCDQALREIEAEPKPRTKRSRH